MSPTSALSVVEVMRTAERAGADGGRALRVVDELDHLDVDRTVLVAAGRIVRADLRSLDAVHLASAMTFGDELGAVVTYDRRLAAAATDLLLPVHQP